MARANQQANETASATNNASASNAPAQYDERDNGHKLRSTNLTAPRATRTSSHTSDRDQRLPTPDHTSPCFELPSKRGCGVSAAGADDAICDDERPTEHREIRRCPGQKKAGKHRLDTRSRCVASRFAGTREPLLGLGVKASLEDSALRASAALSAIHTIQPVHTHGPR